MKKSGGNWDKKAGLKYILAVVLIIAAIFGFANKSIMNYAKQFFSAGEVPSHEKTRENNKINGVDDLTYKIGLSVTGDAEKQPNHVNVIVIVDRSGSMDTQSGTGAYVPTTGTGTGLYGLVDGEFVPLIRHGTAGNRTFWYDDNGTEVQYEGQRYQYDSTATRLQATQAAVNGLASSLLAYNEEEGNDDDTVEMALVSFATTSRIDRTPTTSASDFISSVNALNANGGTNWEAALQEANNISFGDNDPTYVIFFSDGSPTFHSSDGGYNNWNNTYNVYGTGQEQEPNMERSYTQAVDDATTLATKVGASNFYTIFAYGTNTGSTYMKNLTTSAGAPAGNNYSASNTAELRDAFNEILENIEMAGIGAVEINDGTTNKVSTSTGVVSLLEVDESSYKYYKTNKETGELEEWTDPENDPDLQAKLQEDGTVKWDLSKLGVLENDVTYKVTFDVYPSQTTYDYIAELENGTRTYESLPSEVREYLKRTGTELGGYSYALETNTTATLSYTDTRNGESNTVEYDNPPAVPTTADKISISKEWDNSLDNREKGEVGVKLLKSDDGETYEDFCFTTTCDAKLNKGNNWSIDNIYIATGLARVVDGKLVILDAGHDYKFAELGSESYYWELETEIVHPMIVNGILKKLILIEDTSEIPEMDGNYLIDGSTEYFILNGKTYKSTGDDPSIKAENNRRSNLNITKTVDGPTADPDDEFTFNIKVVEKDADGNEIVSSDTVNHNDYLWFSVMDADGNYITLDETPDNWTLDGGSYYAPNKTVLTVKLKAGYNLRFFNLHSGTTFDVTETDLDDYTLINIKETEERKVPQDGVEPEDWPTESKEIQTVTTSTLSGTILENNRTYVVEATNKYEKVKATVKKEWPDDNENAEGLRKPIRFDLKDESGTVVDSITLDGTVDANGETAAWFGEFEEQPRYSGGNEIKYTISEDLSGIEDHYTSTVSPASGDATKGLVTVTNNRIPEDLTTKVNGAKTWDDEDDQDGLRPESIEIKLIADGDEENPVATKTVTPDKDGNWTYEFNDLPKYKNGKEIKYTIIETPVTDYEDPTYDESGINVTNTHSPFETQVSVTKIWEDNDDQDGIRPESIDVTLLVVDKNGNKIPYSKEGLTNPVTLNEDNDWSYTWTGLPRRAGGQDITYEVSELVVPEEYESDQANISPTQETTPYDNGNQTYVSSESYEITNTYEPEETEVSVTKVWEDQENQDAIRPTSVTVQLYKDGVEEGDPVVLDSSNSWTKTWTGLDKFEEHGTKIEYTVDEIGIDQRYTPVITLDEKENEDEPDSWTITNNYVPQKTEVSVTKVWEDNNNQDGIRPDSIDVQLYKDGVAISLEERADAIVTLDEDNQWTFTWEGLEKNKNVNGRAVAIEYTVDEVNEDGEAFEPDGYTKEITLDEKESEDAPDSWTITNTHEPEVTEVSVTKVWEDAGDQDGIRPDSINVQLYKDGVAEGKPVTLDEDNQWTKTWTELQKYKDEGTEIEYTVDEVDENGEAFEPDGYTKEITLDEKESEDAPDSWTITNTHETEDTQLTVIKVWEDDDNSQGTRPDSISVTIYQPDETGNPVEVDRDDSTVTLSEDNQWTYTWEGLEKNKGGEEIVYSVDEATVSRYTKQISAISNDRVITITNTVEDGDKNIKITKYWSDANNQDGIRPTSLSVTLIGIVEGEANPVVNETLTLTGSNNGDTWTFNKVVPEFYEGKLIKYSIIEDDSSFAAINYEFDEVSENTITSDQDEDFDIEVGFKLDNKHTPELIPIHGNKIWDDEDDQDGIRPESIKITLMADGEPYGETLIVEPDQDGNWSYDFGMLPKYKPGEVGKEIVYSIVETPVTDYNDPTYDDNSLDVTNTHSPFETQVSVTKTWEDNDDQDGIRPESIDVTLLIVDKNGNKIPYSKEGLTNPVTLNEDNDWSYTWTGLPRRAGGQDITYEVSELVVPEEYESDQANISPTQETTPYDNGNQTYVSSESYAITNTHEPTETEVSVTKVWEDDDNRDGLRPDKVYAMLYVDGEPYSSNPVVLNEGNSWTYTWTGLDKFKDQGTEIEYTVDEVDEKGNSTKIDGYNKDITLDEKENETEPDSWTITNTHETEKTKVKVTKDWNDNNNQDGVRPDSVEVQLYKDGVAVTTNERLDAIQVLDESNGWTYEWTELEKNKTVDGTTSEIAYSVKENNVDSNYTATDGTKDNNYVVTNTHEPEKTEITVTKAWEDDDDRDGIRPDSINVQLYKDGIAEGNPVSIDESMGWTYTWTELDKFRDEGVTIEYTVDEVDENGNAIKIDGYEKEITLDEKSEDTDPDSYTITNTHTPSTIKVPVVKRWIDENGETYRPDGVSISLLANGTEVNKTTVTGDKTAAEWTHTFETDSNGDPLYEFENGEPIKYTVVENGTDEGNLGKYYTPSYPEPGEDGNQLVVINTINDLNRPVKITKAWDDNNNQDVRRPSSISVTLVGNIQVTVDGEVKPKEVYNKTISISGGLTADSWEYTIEDVPIFSEGKLITYTLSEQDIEYYVLDPEVGISGNPDEGYTIKNNHTPETVGLTVTKEWDDANDQDGKRTDSVDVQLYKDGIEEGDPVTLSESNSWKKEWTGLDKYKNDNGTRHEIVYTVKELKVPTGYEAKLTVDEKDEKVITNSHTPEVITYHIKKTWNDFDNQEGVRPDKIIVRVFKGEEQVAWTEVTGPDWEYTFTLDKYTDGVLNQYTILEDEVPLYITPEIEQNNTEEETKELFTDIFNNLDTTQFTVDITVYKIWKDDDNKYNVRPQSITVVLYADGDAIEKAILSKENSWTYTWEGLPKYPEGTEDGVPIEYTVEEETVDNYKATITGSVEEGFTITNTYDGPPETEIVPPKTAVLSATEDYTLYELLIMLLTVITTLVTLTRVEE